MARSSRTSYQRDYQRRRRWADDRLREAHPDEWRRYFEAAPTDLPS